MAGTDDGRSTGQESALFFVSGFIGTVLFNLFYMGLFALLPVAEGRRATVCWGISYFASIAWQHKLHAVIVFPHRHIDNYWASLGKTYAVYSVSFVLSTVLMGVLEGMGVNYVIAWTVALVSTGLINYFVVRDFAMK